MSEIPSPINPPERLLCGPGPCNVSPAVLQAMQRPLLGHMDPDFIDLLGEVVSLLRIAWNARSGLVLPLQSTGTAGMEAGLAHLLEPGDEAIIAVNGFFGRRMVEIARRLGAEVVSVQADWGEAVDNERILEALDRHPRARLVAVVHAETSSGVRHPLAELGAALRGGDVLLMADCVTSLGGCELDFDGWGVDYAYSCSQKCIGAPPGMSPVAVSDRALERIEARAASTGDGRAAGGLPYSLDLLLLRDYWVRRPMTYHHTAPVLHIYAMHEALREVAVEGLEARWARHAEAGAFLQAALVERGLELLADEPHRLSQLTAVRVPDGVDGGRVQTRMLREHGIEIGGGLGPIAPPMWRLGLMGVNARVAVAERLLEALDAVLESEPSFAARA
ncbi:MAG TPA: alanine--glyoxylate aminotransferase family protein [Solirubrobacteraceae bacterium]|nr:alanine--glyoxylate aminotransferase family protein [Solirubrobacteraceae bacterium]